MTITNTGRRIVFVGLLALVASMMPFTGAAADHLTGDPVKLDADNNIDASLLWSDPGAFPDAGLASGARDPQYVLIGRDDLFADNLASGALQGADGPLLLTDSDTLSDDVADEIDRLGVDEAIILGGVNAISDTVSEQLADLDGIETVTRIQGETRIETSIEITAFDSTTDTALLVRAYDADGGDTSQAYVDALAAGAWAAEAGAGVLLTQTEVLTPSVAEFLGEGQIENVIIIGGVDAVSAAVEAEVTALVDTVSRVAGDNRADTAVQIAEARMFDSASDADGIILSEGGADEGDIWADGLAAAATSALEGYPIVLSNGEDLPPETAAFAGADTVSDDAAFMQVTGDAPSIAIVCGPFTTTDACVKLVTIVRGDTSIDGGIVGFVDTTNDAYLFISDTTNDTVVVAYDTVNDVFVVDRIVSDPEEFEETISPLDQITVFYDTTSDGVDYFVTQIHVLQSLVDSDFGAIVSFDLDADFYVLDTLFDGDVPVGYFEDDVFTVDGTITDLDGFEDALPDATFVMFSFFNDGSARHELSSDDIF